MKGLKGFAALLAAVVSIGAAGAIGTQRTEQEVHFYGVVRHEATGWVLLNNATHKPSGLGVVRCEPGGSGELEIHYLTPLVTVGAVSVTPDEAYVTKIMVGASVGLNAIFLTLKKPDGTKLHCLSPLTQINNSNFFLDGTGTVLA